MPARRPPPTLAVERVARWRPSKQLVFLALHATFLALQWLTIRNAPVIFDRASARGWTAICIGAKGP